MNKKIIQKCFDNVADAYDEARIIPDFVIQKVFSIMNDRIHLNENRVILDVGIGTGRTCRSLSQYDVELIGIDISPKMLRRCLEVNRDEISVGKIALIQGDITCLPFKNSTFDIIMGMHIFDFIGKEAIKEIKRVMNLRGFLIIINYTTPIRETIIAKKYRELHRKHSARAKERLLWICNSLVPAFEKVSSTISKRRFSYIEKSGTTVQTESIIWTQKVQISQILNVLEKKVYSNYYDTPDKTQSRIMKELKKWIEKAGVGDSEEVKCIFEMKIIKF